MPREIADALDTEDVEMSEEELGRVYGGLATDANARCAMVEAETVM